MIVQTDTKWLAVFLLIILGGAVFLGFTVSTGEELSAVKAAQARRIDTQTEQIALQKKQIEIEMQNQAQREIALQQLEAQQRQLETQERAINLSYLTLTVTAVTSTLVAIGLVAYLVLSTYKRQASLRETLRLGAQLKALQVHAASIGRQTSLSRQLAIEARRSREDAEKLLQSQQSDRFPNEA